MALKSGANVNSAITRNKTILPRNVNLAIQDFFGADMLGTKSLTMLTSSPERQTKIQSAEFQV